MAIKTRYSALISLPWIMLPVMVILLYSDDYTGLYGDYKKVYSIMPELMLFDTIKQSWWGDLPPMIMPSAKVQLLFSTESKRQKFLDKLYQKLQIYEEPTIVLTKIDISLR